VTRSVVVYMEGGVVVYVADLAREDVDYCVLDWNDIEEDKEVPAWVLDHPEWLTNEAWVDFLTTAPKAGLAPDTLERATKLREERIKTPGGSGRYACPCDRTPAPRLNHNGTVRAHGYGTTKPGAPACPLSGIPASWTDGQAHAYLVNHVKIVREDVRPIVQALVDAVAKRMQEAA
jgi:hypothetical protein